MVTIEIDGLRGTGETERQAKAALRKAQREAAEKAQEHERRREMAYLRACQNYVRFANNHFNRESTPLPLEVCRHSQTSAAACAEWMSATQLKLHHCNGSHVLRVGESFDIIKVIDSAPGISAVCVLTAEEKPTGYAVGFCDDVIQFVALPEPVAMSLFYPA